MPALYVYGFVPAAGPPVDLPPGVGGAQASIYRFGEVAAIVSPLASVEVAGRARDVRAHEELLRRALTQRTTVLPLRFGTVYESLDGLESGLLEPSEERLASLLAELDATVEFQLRAVYLEQERVLRQLVASDNGLRRERDRARGAGYAAQVALGEAVASAFERRRDNDRRRLRDDLSPFARGVVEQREISERVAAQLAFLVERHAVGRFEAEAESCAARHSGELVVSLTGPLPPYSFVAFELEQAGAR